MFWIRKYLHNQQFSLKFPPFKRQRFTYLLFKTKSVKKVIASSTSSHTSPLRHLILRTIISMNICLRYKNLPKVHFSKEIIRPYYTGWVVQKISHFADPVNLHILHLHQVFIHTINMTLYAAWCTDERALDESCDTQT